MNKEQLFETWFSKLCEEANATAFISGIIDFDIPETPEGMRGWTAHDGASEVDWSEYWESEVIHDINHSIVKLKTPNGIYATVDFEFLGSSLSSSRQGASFESAVHGWVDVPNKEALSVGPYILIMESVRFGKVELPISNFKVEDYDF